MAKNRFTEINESQIYSGIEAALKNASRLAGDAELLLKHDRFPSATSLAILGLEELGKIPIILNLSVARDKRIKEKLLETLHTSHTKKTEACLAP